MGGNLLAITKEGVLRWVVTSNVGKVRLAVTSFGGHAVYYHPSKKNSAGGGEDALTLV